MGWFDLTDAGVAEIYSILKCIFKPAEASLFITVNSYFHWELIYSVYFSHVIFFYCFSLVTIADFCNLELELYEETPLWCHETNSTFQKYSRPSPNPLRTPFLIATYYHISDGDNCRIWHYVVFKNEEKLLKLSVADPLGCEREAIVSVSQR